METEQWLVCYGSPDRGFNLVGLFPSSSEAIQWGEEHIYTDPWWIMDVQTLDEFDKENA